jgi:hypothetical protein
MTSVSKSEAKRIDEYVAEGLRLIGLPAADLAALPSLPRQVPISSKPTENAPAKVTIGDASR